MIYIILDNIMIYHYIGFSETTLETGNSEFPDEEK
jgi:hypothetical protein